MINARAFFNQPNENNVRTYESINKIDTGRLQKSLLT